MIIDCNCSHPINALSSIISIELGKLPILILGPCKSNKTGIIAFSSFSKNLRNEINGNRTRKIYFYDVGIRNALIGNFQRPELRNDIGGIWENFCIVELMKKAQKEGKFPHRYFWRTYQGQEIDFLEEIDGQIFAYEFKYNANKQAKLPKAFQDTYSVARYSVINKQNGLEYLL